MSASEPARQNEPCARAWYRPRTPYAFALGQVVAVALLGDGASLELVAAVEVGLFVLLVTPLAAADARTLPAFVVATVGLLAVLEFGRWVWEPLWLAAVAAGLVAATAAYGIHRYERVRLGLVEEAT